jgi:hypothetical protein
METRKKTILIIKETRKVPELVTENRNKYNMIRKIILESLKDEGKTIPQIADATKLPLFETTYYLLSLHKFGDVMVEGVDDMDEYFIYKLKK